MNADGAPDVVVVGAGIAGLAAARELTRRGRRVQVVDKARGVGGRMATRRVGEARIDHGAQFFTVRDDRFRATVDAALAAGAVVEWTQGFHGDGDGHPRYRGVDGMTALCKWVAADCGVPVELGRPVADLREMPAPAYVLTAPVPQSLAILSLSAMLPAPQLADALAAVRYRATIAVLATLDRDPTAMAAHGGHHFVDHPDLGFVSDNRAKGISAVPALTVHLSNDRSEAMWGCADAEIVAAAEALTGTLRGRAAFVDAQVQRWRYAGPRDVWPDATVGWGSTPRIALAGEVFAGPKVEGAFLSGLAAAEAVDDHLG